MRVCNLVPKLASWWRKYKVYALSDGDRRRRERSRCLSSLCLGERDRELRRRVPVDGPASLVILSRLSATLPFERRNRLISSPSSSTPSSRCSTGPSNGVAGWPASFSLLRFHMSFFRHRGQSTTFTSALLRFPCS